MKTNKYIFSVLGFMSGILLGFSVLGLFSFSNGPGSAGSGPGIVPISAADAQTFLRNYMSDAIAINAVIKGFTIDKAQLEAMNAISKENPNLAGFRVYLGKDNSSRMIGIVVGIDSEGKDAVNGKVYNTDRGALSPCPPVCDVSSSIIKN